MTTGTIRLALAATAAWAVLGCGGPPPKQAGCPDGTVEKDGSCVPAGDSSASAGDDASGSSGSSGTSGSSSGSSGSGGSSGSSDSSGSAGSGGDPSASGGSAPYDQQMVGAKLKRAAGAVKKNCGSATEEDGKVHGPWGATKVSVVIDNNGHSRDASIPSPYDGTAVGRCATHAFENFQFPPFKGADQHVDVDVEIVKPAGAP